MRPFFRQRQAPRGRLGGNLGLGPGRRPHAIFVHAFLDLHKSALLHGPKSQAAGSRWCCRTPESETHPAALGRAARGPTGRSGRSGLPPTRLPARRGRKPHLHIVAVEREQTAPDVLLLDRRLQLLRPLQLRNHRNRVPQQTVIRRHVRELGAELAVGGRFRIP